jgi:hypothetical protein
MEKAEPNTQSPKREAQGGGQAEACIHTIFMYPPLEKDLG